MNHSDGDSFSITGKHLGLASLALSLVDSLRSYLSNEGVASAAQIPWQGKG